MTGVDIFGEYALLIGQLLSLVAIVGLFLQAARYFQRKNIAKDWTFFVLLLVAIVGMQVFTILRFNDQFDHISKIEQLQVKLQNLTLMNQGIIKHVANLTKATQQMLANQTTITPRTHYLPLAHGMPIIEFN